VLSFRFFFWHFSIPYTHYTGYCFSNPVAWPTWNEASPLCIFGWVNKQDGSLVLGTQCTRTPTKLNEPNPSGSGREREQCSEGTHRTDACCHMPAQCKYSFGVPSVSVAGLVQPACLGCQQPQRVHRACSKVGAVKKLV
jgi:hypothetical protein